jgi:hypothetical protein
MGIYQLADLTAQVLNTKPAQKHKYNTKQYKCTRQNSKETKQL